MNKSSGAAGRGRRTGSPDTRELILAAARRRFLAEGYQSVTLRAIAAEAEVDVALLSYYFGSKKSLFATALALPANPAEIFQKLLKGDLDTLAPRALAALLAVWDAPATGEPLRVVAATAAHDPESNRLVRELVGRELITPLTRRLTAEGLEPIEASRRAAAFTTQMAGLIFGRYLLRLEPIASMDADQVARLLGPSLQVALRPRAD